MRNMLKNNKPMKEIWVEEGWEESDLKTEQHPPEPDYSLMEMPLESIERLTKDMMRYLRVGMNPRLNESNIEPLSKAVYKAELLYLATKSVAAKNILDLNMKNSVLRFTIEPSHCEYIDGVFIMEFPFLLPNRSRFHKTRFFAWEVQERVRGIDIDDAFREAYKYVIFEHHYPENYPKNLIRDNDNTEEKWLLDALIGTVLTDDGPEHCSLIFKTVLKSKLKTRVVVCTEKNVLKIV